MSKLILSLDGGGIRGAATTQFLFRVEQELQKNGKSIRDYVDFYAGTSTGSIIALALATTNLSMEEINNLYNYENGREIFTDDKRKGSLGGKVAPRYQGKGKKQLLEQKLGRAKVGDVAKSKHILAVTYAVEQRKPEIIKSTNTEHCKLRSSEVADASSAAPTYFPTKEMNVDGTSVNEWLVDGGVTANNPTMCAIAEAKKVWKKTLLEDIRVLSIGTGYRTESVNGRKSQDWGAIGWFVKGHILDILSDERVVSYQALTLMGEGKYIRVNSEMRNNDKLPPAPSGEMDKVTPENITRLKGMGDFWFEQYGKDVIKLLQGTYKGKSLDRIDSNTGKPKVGK